MACCNTSPPRPSSHPCCSRFGGGCMRSWRSCDLWCGGLCVLLGPRLHTRWQAALVGTHKLRSLSLSLAELCCALPKYDPCRRGTCAGGQLKRRDLVVDLG